MTASVNSINYWTQSVNYKSMPTALDVIKNKSTIVLNSSCGCGVSCASCETSGSTSSCSACTVGDSSPSCSTSCGVSCASCSCSV